MEAKAGDSYTEIASLISILDQHRIRFEEWPDRALFRLLFDIAESKAVLEPHEGELRRCCRATSLMILSIDNKKRLQRLEVREPGLNNDHSYELFHHIIKQEECGIQAAQERMEKDLRFTPCHPIFPLREMLIDIPSHEYPGLIDYIQDTLHFTYISSEQFHPEGYTRHLNGGIARLCWQPLSKADYSFFTHR